MNETVFLATEPLPDEELPKAFRIFAAGWNHTSKGKFLFDDQAAESVLKDYQAQNNDLCIDYDHKALDPEARAGDGKAAGWFQLELGEQGGLWAVNVRWTPPAAEALANREWRYFSPAFTADPKSKRILQLVNIALTNIPATRNMKPLVAASAVPFAAYPVVKDKWDAKAATTRLRHWASTTGQNHKSVIDWDKYALGFAWFDESKRDAFSSYKLPHHDVRSGRLVTSRDGVLAAGAAVMGARGGVNLPPSELEAVRAHLARHYRQFDMSPPWEPEENAIMADKKKPTKSAPPPDEEEMNEEEEGAEEEEEAAADTEEEEEAPESEGAEEEEEEEPGEDEVDANEAEDEEEPEEGEDEEEEEPDEEEPPPKAKKKAARLSVLRAAKEFTGKTRASEIIGVLRAHRAAHVQVTQLSARLQKVEGDLRLTKVRALVGRAVRAGKVAPAMRKWALTLGKRDIEQLRAYIEQAPPLVNMDRPLKPPAPGGGAELVTLSADELRVCELIQVSPAAFARHKATGVVTKESP
ncbi:MAG TPA: phage protease [Polyangiaceae bacterium]|nr:phage protease [Polyangiaceae bacterium]